MTSSLLSLKEFFIGAMHLSDGFAPPGKSSNLLHPPPHRRDWSERRWLNEEERFANNSAKIPPMKSDAFLHRRGQHVTSMGAVFAAVLCVSTTASSQVILPGIATSQLDAKLKGRVLIEELNCMACHGSTASFAAQSKRAPRLAGVGSRVNPAHLEAFIRDPHGVKPGITMPDVMGSMNATDRATRTPSDPGPSAGRSRRDDEGNF